MDGIGSKLSSTSNYLGRKTVYDSHRACPPRNEMPGSGCDPSGWRAANRERMRADAAECSASDLSEWSI